MTGIYRVGRRSPELGRNTRPDCDATDAADPEQVQDWTELTHYPSGEIATSTDPWNITTSYEHNLLGL